MKISKLDNEMFLFTFMPNTHPQRNVQGEKEKWQKKETTNKRKKNQMRPMNGEKKHTMFRQNGIPLTLMCYFL